MDKNSGKTKEIKLRNKIKNKLLAQLKENGINDPVSIDLVNDYMDFWDIKNRLIEDIRERGVSVRGATGALKKNDSISELNKTSAHMLKVLNELNLKAVVEENDDDADL